MSELFHLQPTEPEKIPARAVRSPKRIKVLEHLKTKDTISLDEAVRLIGEVRDERTHSLRDSFGRNHIPVGFYDVRTEAGQGMLAGLGVTVYYMLANAAPVLIWMSGTDGRPATSRQYAARASSK